MNKNNRDHDDATPSKITPFLPWPSFSKEDIFAVSSVLASGRVNYWTGIEGREFEKEFAAHCGVSHAIALADSEWLMHGNARPVSR